MLCAQTLEGNRVCLTPYSRVELKAIRNAQDFFCPSCNEKLILKIGTEITPHFSHSSVSTCSGGGEGEIHERGKWLLYSWLKKSYEDVVLESYVREINQRPDILLTIASKKYAVEFQYSSISTAEIRKRNGMYKRAKIIPVWFLDVKHLQQRSQATFLLNSFAKQFLFQPVRHPSPIILFFCTKTEQIISLQNILFISLTKVLSQKHVYPLKSYNWNDLFRAPPSTKKQYLIRWSVEKKKFRMQQRRSVGKQKEWLLWLYKRRLPIDYLPSVIYLPVKGQMLMNVQPWNWQSRLWYYLQYEVGEYQSFTLDDCNKYLTSFMYPTQYYPLLIQTNSPITSYIEWLCLLGYVKRKNNQTYRIQQAMPPHAHIEEAVSHDALLMDHIMQLHES